MNVIHILWAILYLIFLECALSVDNALAIAALVKRKLPKGGEEHHIALTWGMWGAMLFRALAIFCGLTLMQFWWVKIAVGIYLITMAVNELWLEETDGLEGKGGFDLTRFWGLSPLVCTIISVEITDFLFSFDSIGATFGVTNDYHLLIFSACVGIAAMRLVSKKFIKLIEQIPILETAAFVLVGLAGLSLVVQGLRIEIPDWVQIGVPFVVVAGLLGWDKYVVAKD